MASGGDGIAGPAAPAPAVILDDNRDPGWKYCSIIIPGNKNNLKCNLCHNTYNGGIRRLKEHLAGGFRNAKACPKCPIAIREEMIEFMASKKKLKEQLNIDRLNRARMDNYIEDDLVAELEDEEDELAQGATLAPCGSKRSATGSASGTGSTGVPSKKQKGPLNMFFAAQGQKLSKDMKEQMEVNERARKELRSRACQQIARWMYDAGIAFNAANLDSFQVMINAIGQYGPEMKAPSYHELRVPLLKKEVEITHKAMQEHEKEWEQIGCSLMADGWKDRRERSILNFLVNSPRGSMFIESIDASDYAKTGDKLFQLFAEKVELVGPHRVIQVVTDSAANNKYAGKLLEVRFPHLFWTPCAAHCIDLIMEDIFKVPGLKRTHAKSVKLTSFVYNRPSVVNMMRKFTGGVELLRPATTRFATTFIVMSRIHQLKSELRAMFTSKEWSASKWSKEQEGKNATSFIYSAQFWNNIVYAIKIAAPLVDVLRLVDGEQRPAMGYIYEAMDRAKERIAKNFHYKEDKYKNIFGIIDKRWDDQLHQPLHAAGNYLNPEYFYKEGHDADGEVFEGLMKCIDKMYPAIEDQDQIAKDLERYKHAEGLFGSNWAIRHRIIKSPAEWWDSYGKKVPKLQQFAKRVLSLTCSSSGCERNFSIFEHLHSKKRNRLDQKRLNDLVFVKYNRALRRRFDRREILDPISLDHIDDNNEFLTGVVDSEDDEVHEGLSWRDVARASGADEPPRRLRSNVDAYTTTPTTYERRMSTIHGPGGIESSRSRRLSLVPVDEDEEDEAEYEESTNPASATTSKGPVSYDLEEEDEDELDED